MNETPPGEPHGRQHENPPEASASADAGQAPSRVLNLQDFLPYRLSVLSNLVSGLIARDYSARFGITIPQWRVLAVLAESGELTARDLEPIVRMDKVAISRAVRSLSDRGLVRRRASQLDGRLAYLGLTAEGRRVYDEVVPTAEKHEAALLAALSPEEIDTLSALLAKLDARALALNGSGPAPGSVTGAQVLGAPGAPNDALCAERRS